MKSVTNTVKIAISVMGNITALLVMAVVPSLSVQYLSVWSSAL
jgi:hypothetical protein